MLAGVCLLAFTFTISECRHVINKKQTENPCLFTSYLQHCLRAFTCMSKLISYYEECVGGNSAVAIINATNTMRDNTGDNTCLQPSDFGFGLCC